MTLNVNKFQNGNENQHKGAMEKDSLIFLYEKNTYINGLKELS